MALRRLSIFAAMAQPALAINRKVMSGDELDASLALSVQARQYALMHSNEGLAEGLAAAAVDGPKPSNLVAGLTARSLGEASSLSEEGYSAVASLKSKEAMEAFAERLLADEGLEVKDLNMLRRVLPFFNGECATQSFKALQTELREATAPHGCKAAWVAQDPSAGKKSISLLAKESGTVRQPQNGDVAPLTEEGYFAVAALKSNEEMKKFIRRLSKADGLNVMNEGGLSGFAPYYSGVCATQSLVALRKELKSVQPVVKTTAISYEISPDEDEDALRQRIAAATGLKPDQISIGSSDGGVPDVAQLKEAMAEHIGVDEDRVNVMNFDAVQPQADETPPSAEQPPAPAMEKATRTVVVTVTAADGVSVEDALKNFSDGSMTANGEPVTMVASIPKPQSCGGGWAAPSAAN